MNRIRIHGRRIQHLLIRNKIIGIKVSQKRGRMTYIITAEIPGRDSQELGDLITTGDCSWLLREMCNLTGGFTAESLKKADTRLPRTGEDYLEYIQIHIGLRRLHEKDSSVLKSNTEEIFDRQLWEELARNENTAETIEIELSKDAAAVKPEIPIPARQSVRINKFSI